MIEMKFKIMPLLTACIFLPLSFSTQATELDQYLIQKNLIDAHFKIKDTKNLDALLNALSEEDSRVFPVQVDQNTVIEKMQLFHDHIDLQGLITSEDFNQFANSAGKDKTHDFLLKGLIENCHSIFENEFQRQNPYYVKMKLVSQQKSYELKVENNQCKF